MTCLDPVSRKRLEGLRNYLAVLAPQLQNLAQVPALQHWAMPPAYGRLGESEGARRVGGLAVRCSKIELQLIFRRGGFASKALEDLEEEVFI